MTSDNKQTISYDALTSLDLAGKLVSSTLERAQATPEFKIYLQAREHFNSLAKMYNYDPNVIDYKGDLEMVFRTDDERPSMTRPDTLPVKPHEAKTPEQLREEAGVQLPDEKPATPVWVMGEPTDASTTDS